jgi:uncharacterized protein (DUF2062 family)
MPKRFINKYLPPVNTVKKHRSLRWLGVLLHDTNLWHLNRRSVASAVFAGVFASFLPIPMQMLFAASLAVVFHCNLPLSVALTWISNPLTYAPIYYLCYRLGLLIIGQDYDPSSFQWNVESMGNNFALVMKPLMVGCIVSGLSVGALGYIGVRMLWRLHIQHTWFKRKAKRAKQIGKSMSDKLRNNSQSLTPDEDPSTNKDKDTSNKT